MATKRTLESPAASRNSSTKILVVDDDAQVLGLLTKTLQKGGYSAVGTTSGSEAVELLRKQDFDLMVLDLEMPKLDGFDILKLTRPKRDRIKIIVISGYLDGALLEAARLLGAVCAIEKPVTGPRLLAEVQNVIDGVRHK